MSASDACIVKACQECWELKTSAGLANKGNCSGFLKGVAEKLGVNITQSANADGLIDFMKNQKWTEISSGSDAAAKASAGMFVVAGLKSSEHKPARTHGHVAVVVSGTMYRGKYPKCWCGSIGGAQSQGTKSTGEIWNNKDRDSVVYYMYPLAVCSA